MAPIEKVMARRVNCQDPCIQNKWINVYKKIVIEHNLLEQANYLKKNITCPLSTKAQQWYKQLDQLQLEAI